jgi:hypothetical protein
MKRDFTDALRPWVDKQGAPFRKLNQIHSQSLLLTASMTLELRKGYRIDVHTHPAPFGFWKDTMIEAGFPLKDTPNGKNLFIDGFPMATIDEAMYIDNRSKFGFDFSVLSISPPGVQHVKDAKEASSLARKLNEEMHRLVCPCTTLMRLSQRSG